MPGPAEVAGPFIDVWGGCGMRGGRDLFVMQVQVLVRFYSTEADLLIPMTRSSEKKGSVSLICLFFFNSCGVLNLLLSKYQTVPGSLAAFGLDILFPMDTYSGADLGFV